jgi:hypothetical protein
LSQHIIELAQAIGADVASLQAAVLELSAVDGGGASSVYLTIQQLDGGGANG